MKLKKIKRCILKITNKNNLKKISISIYYAMCFIFIITTKINIGSFFRLIMLLFLPFAIGATIKILKRKYEKNSKKEFILCILPILIATTSYFVSIDYKKIQYYKDQTVKLQKEINVLEERNKTLEKSKKNIKSKSYIDEIMDDELLNLKQENNELRNEINEKLR